MKQPLFLIHGWGVNAGAWHPALGQLQELFEVTVADLPGYGSLAGYQEQYSLDNVSNAVLEQAPERAAWLGWSFGGMIAMHAAISEKERITSLHLVNTTPKFVADDSWSHGTDPVMFADFAKGFERDRDAALVSWLALQAGTAPGARAVIRRMVKLLSRAPAPQSRILTEGLELLCSVDMRSQLSAIEQPVQLISGNRDNVTPTTAMRFLASGIGNSRLDILDAAHIPFVSCPEEFVACLAEALSNPEIVH